MSQSQFKWITRMAVISICLILTGCGGDDDDSNDSFTVSPHDLNIPLSGSSLQVQQPSQLNEAGFSDDNDPAKLTIRNQGDDKLKDLSISPSSNWISITKNNCSDDLAKNKSCTVEFKAIKKGKDGTIKVSTKNAGKTFVNYTIDAPELEFENLPSEPVEIAIGQGQHQWCGGGKEVQFENKSSVATAENISISVTGGKGHIHAKADSNDCDLDDNDNLAPGDSCHVCLKADGPPDDPNVGPSDPDDLPKLEISAQNDSAASANLKLVNSQISIDLPNGGLISEPTTGDGREDKPIIIKNTGSVPAYFKKTTDDSPDKEAAKIVKPESGGDFGNFEIDNVDAAVENTDVDIDCRNFDNTGGADTLLDPASKCYLPLKVFDGAFGMGELDLSGNFENDRLIFINISPTTVQFLEPPEDPNNDNVPIDYALVPDSDIDRKTIIIKNTGDFTLHNANFSVQPGEFKVDHVSSSCTNLKHNKTCKIKIARDDASAGKEGIVQLTADNLLNERSRLPIGVKGDLLVFPQFKQDTRGANADSSDFEVQPMLNFQKVWVVNALDNGLKKDGFQNPTIVDDNDNLLSITATDDEVHPSSCINSTGSQGHPPTDGSPCTVWIKLKEDNNRSIGHSSVGKLQVQYTPQGGSQKQKTKKLSAFADRYILAGGTFSGAEDSNGQFVSNTLRLALYGPNPSNHQINSWSSLASIGGNAINTAYVDTAGGELYLGGQLESVDHSTQLFNITRFDGRRWHPLAAADTSDSGVGGEDADVYAIQKLGDYTYVTGDFLRAGQQNKAQNVARWQPDPNDDRNPDVGEWKFMGKQGVPGLQTGPGLSLLSDSGNNEMVVGGQFDQAGNDTGFNSVAAWKTSNKTWNNVGSGLSSKDFDEPRVDVLADFSGSRVAGGNFVVGSNDQFGLASLNNSQWQSFSESPIKRLNSDSAVKSFAQLSTTMAYANASKDFLFVGGQFKTDNQGNHLVGYDNNGDSWFSMGDPSVASGDEMPQVEALTTYQTDNKDFVVAGGQFDDIGQASSVNNIAVCDFDANAEDKCSWQSLGKGVVSGEVRALKVLTELHMDILS